MIFHKFHAVATTVDDIKFASKREARYFNELKLRKLAGEVIFFLRQVPFHLPGGSRHVIDFAEFRADGTVAFVEIKGFDTPSGKMKRKIVEALFPIKIEVIR